MQTEAASVFDLSTETEATKQLYGMNNPASSVFGQECLLARRLLEHGVRFVQIFDTLPNGHFHPWDMHETQIPCSEVVRPVPISPLPAY